MKTIIQVALFCFIYSTIICITILFKIASMIWHGKVDDSYFNHVEKLASNIVSLP